MRKKILFTFLILAILVSPCFGQFGYIQYPSSPTSQLPLGPLTNGYICVYSSTLGLVCNTNPASYLPISGGTLTGNLLFTDNTYDIGASAATRPRTIYVGTSIITPNLTDSALTSTYIPLSGTGGLLGNSNITSDGTTANVGSATAGGNLSVLSTRGAELLTLPNPTSGAWTASGTGFDLTGATLNKNATGVGTVSPTTITILANRTYVLNMTYTGTGSPSVTLGGSAAISPTTATDTYITTTSTATLTLSSTVTAGTFAVSAISLKLLDNTTGIFHASGPVYFENMSRGYFPYLGSDKQLTAGPIFTNGTNVGIGTTSPQYKLDVNGIGNFSSTLQANAPVAVTSFSGTISSSGTTIIFSDPADAVLAGYTASKTTVGATVVAAGTTKYIQGWTDSTHAVTNSSTAWGAGTAITSTKLPIQTFLKSDGTAAGFIDAPYGALHLLYSSAIAATISVNSSGELSLSTTGGTQHTIRNTDTGETGGYIGYMYGGANSASYMDFYRVGDVLNNYGIRFYQGTDIATAATSVYLFDDKDTAGRLTAASGNQNWMSLEPTIAQSGTAGYTALNINTTQTSVGSGNSYLINAQVAGSSKFAVLSGGNVGIGTVLPTGKQHTVLTSTAPALFGGDTIGSYTTVTFPTANKDYVNKTEIGTGSSAVGDLLIVTGGTGATTGRYRIISLISANSVQVDRNIHASGTDIVDGTVSTVKNVISFGPTDGTNGQMLTSWSAQNKPLQIGGTVLAATTNTGLTSRDIVSGGVHLFKEGYSRNTRTATTTYAIGATDSVIFCTGTFTATLPTPVGITGRVYDVKNIGTGVITLATAEGLIDGLATQTITAQYESITVISDGTNWYII